MNRKPLSLVVGAAFTALLLAGAWPAGASEPVRHALDFDRSPDTPAAFRESASADGKGYIARPPWSSSFFFEFGFIHLRPNRAYRIRIDNDPENPGGDFTLKTFSTDGAGRAYVRGSTSQNIENDFPRALLELRTGTSPAFVFVTTMEARRDGSVGRIHTETP